MKKEILLILLLITIKVNSQSYSVTYNLEQVAKNINLKTNIKTYLKGNGNNSVYVEDFRNSFETSQDESNVLKMPTENNPTYYKDLKKNITIYNDHIRFNFFNILDTVGKFDWKIEEETKKISNYNCQKASITFRGRDFTVYFTTDISVSDGPLKFTGLPGLILEIISNDSVASFHYLVEKIEFSDLDIEIKNIYLDKQIITYDEYLKMYKKKI